MLGWESDIAKMSWHASSGL